MSMQNAFVELMDNSGFFEGSEVNDRKVANAPIADILQFIEHSEQITNIEILDKHQLPFALAASKSLGGGCHPCSGIKCRLDKVKKLSQFASFYSDSVYINNFLGETLLHNEIRTVASDESIRQRFSDDLSIFGYLRNYIESGVVIPVTMPNYCPHCADKITLKDIDEAKIKNSFNYLIKEYQEHSNFEICKVNGEYFIQAKAPESLLEHGFYGNKNHRLLPSVQNIPELVSSIEMGKVVKVSKELQEKANLNEFLASRAMSQIRYELLSTHLLNCPFVTSNEVEISYIRNLTEKNSEMEIRNSVIQENLSCLVPFIDDIDPKLILKLRNEEHESFIIFRQHLNKTIEEVIAQKNKFGKREASQIYADILAPSLAALDKSVHSAYRLLTKETYRKATAWGGVISFGMFTGLLPESVAGLATAIGLANVGTPFLTDIMTKSDTEETIRDSEMYFLWKLRPKNSNS